MVTVKNGCGDLIKESSAHAPISALNGNGRRAETLLEVFPFYPKSSSAMRRANAWSWFCSETRSLGEERTGFPSWYRGNKLCHDHGGTDLSQCVALPWSDTIRFKQSREID